eukprot:c20036_g1_i1 orf=317-733(+)
MRWMNYETGISMLGDVKDQERLKWKEMKNSHSRRMREEVENLGFISIIAGQGVTRRSKAGLEQSRASQVGKRREVVCTGRKRVVTGERSSMQHYGSPHRPKEAQEHRRKSKNGWCTSVKKRVAWSKEGVWKHCRCCCE